MDYLPISLDLRGRSCVVVGGGAVACRKADLLCSAGARLTVIAPTLCAEMSTLLARTGGTHGAQAYARGQLEGAALVIAATDDPAVNRCVADDARALGLPVNVVDSPELCSFIMPAIVDRSPVLVAVSTAGASPVLARLTRAAIERLLPERLGDVARWASRHRAHVAARIADPVARRALWERALDGEAARLVLDGRSAAADAVLERLIAGGGSAPSEVVIIEVAQGDTSRLSLAAMRCLGNATLVLASRSGPMEVLVWARRDAPRETLPDALLGDGYALASYVRGRMRGAGTVCVLVQDRAVEPLAAELRGLGIAARGLLLAPRG